MNSFSRLLHSGLPSIVPLVYARLKRRHTFLPTSRQSPVPSPCFQKLGSPTWQYKLCTPTGLPDAYSSFVGLVSAGLLSFATVVLVVRRQLGTRVFLEGCCFFLAAAAVARLFFFASSVWRAIKTKSYEILESPDAYSSSDGSLLVGGCLPAGGVFSAMLKEYTSLVCFC